MSHSIVAGQPSPGMFRIKHDQLVIDVAQGHLETFVDGGGHIEAVSRVYRNRRVWKASLQKFQAQEITNAVQNLEPLLGDVIHEDNVEPLRRNKFAPPGDDPGIVGSSENVQTPRSLFEFCQTASLLAAIGHPNL